MNRHASFLAAGPWLAALVLAFAAAAPGIAEAKKAKIGAPAPPPPPPPPEQEVPLGPPVLSSQVVDLASAYATYMRSATAISPAFGDGPSVATALRTGVHSEKAQMQQGMVAFGAIVALQDPAFAATLREFKLPSQREAIFRYIVADPNYVLTLAGHDSAAGLVITAWKAQGRALRAAGNAVKNASYDIQLQAPWSKQPVPDLMSRLQDVKQLSASPVVADQDLRQQLAQTAAGGAASPAPVAPDPGPYSQATVRSLAIAALAILGKAGDENMDYVRPLLVNDGDGFCFNMAKLNLYQCLSVARPYYEDVYCLGLHAMGDTGRCVITSAGGAEPPEPVILPASFKNLAAKHPAKRRRRR